MAIFIDNKYTKWYYNIIENAKSRLIKSDSYTERHHIIPKSLGGNNDPNNLVRLFGREHYICHLLLPKMLVDDNLKSKMNFALFCMMRINLSQGRFIPCNRMYEIIKKNMATEMSNRMKGNTQSEEANRKRSLTQKGRPGKKHTEETKLKIRKKRAEQVFSEETRQKMSEAKRGKNNPSWKGLTKN